MPNGKILEIGTGRGFRRRGQCSHAGGLPDVPVLPETLLLMELCAQGRSIDLDRMSQIVLGDLGATLQILRRVGAEESLGDERPTRIEDCISALGVKECIQAVSRLTVSRAMNKAAILKTWAHGRQIAECCKLLAEGTSENLNAGEAYMTGLLHELGELPETLDWEQGPMLPGDAAKTVSSLAADWQLPPCVIELFSECSSGAAAGRWTSLIEQAHDAMRTPIASSEIERKADSR